MSLFKNQVAPHRLAITATRSDSAVDLSGTTSADIYVVRGDGTTATWTAQPVSSVSASAFTVTRTLQSGDLSCDGTYRVYVRANPSGWESSNESFNVLSR